ncbi:MAG: PASTA domain-containing protein, partial [Clostridia bacterium]|nr:PASTA domain-containing protein [Clostridia bacterium]
MVSVIGETEERAKAMLEGSGFAAGNITREHADIPEGLVVRQSVAPGEQAAQKYTTVDLVVSLGPKDPPPTTTTTPPDTTTAPATTTTAAERNT